jgi:hypothetical protein
MVPLPVIAILLGSTSDNTTRIERNRVKNAGFEAHRAGVVGQTSFDATNAIVYDGSSQYVYTNGCGGNGTKVDTHITFDPANGINDFAIQFTANTVQPMALSMLTPNTQYEMTILFDMDYIITGNNPGSRLTLNTFMLLQGLNANNEIVYTKKLYEMSQVHDPTNTRIGRRRSSPVMTFVDLQGRGVSRLFFIPAYSASIDVQTPLGISGIVSSDRENRCCVQVTRIR